MDIYEARNHLEQVLGDDLCRDYFKILQRWYTYRSHLEQKQYRAEIGRLLATPAQVHAHNVFSRALHTHASPPASPPDRLRFERAPFADFVRTAAPAAAPPPASAAATLLLPDATFVAARIAAALSEHGLHGVERRVADVLLHASRALLRNVITAMVARKRSYRVRDRKLQYGFGQPVPDRFLVGAARVHEPDQRGKVAVADEGFVPRLRPSLARAEHEAAHAYACARRPEADNLLTARLLYETLRENPRILVFHEMNNLGLLKLSLLLDEESK